MSLWHLSPPLFACVNSSDLFTFTVFPFPDLESAEDPFVRPGGLSVDGVYECIYFIAKPLPPNTAPFLSCLRNTTTTLYTAIFLCGCSTMYLCYF